MKLSGINQLWVADITCIRLKAEFVYLAVILDAFSRKVVGWALDRTLAMRLTVGALEQAIERRQPKSGLVHHSDRGLQYARGEYIALLEKHHMIPSMSRPAAPMIAADPTFHPTEPLVSLRKRNVSQSATSDMEIANTTERVNNAASYAGA
jgi:hypothetical protein